ncbi:mucin-2-like isoform X1 [Oryzias latipes]|uniref:mucin-2-like isoform X1 n=1 Tax=Oryzias latipes TaxID=8090 RepID=UPI000CE202BF|nr:mucin-2-like isoform X1 [Oryzias latipes]
MSFLHHLCGVECPGEVLAEVDPHIFEAAHSLLFQTPDKKRLIRVPPLLPHVHYHLLCLVCVEREVVVLTPSHQTGHLPPVGCFAPASDASYHSSVISKLQDDVFLLIKTFVASATKEPLRTPTITSTSTTTSTTTPTTTSTTPRTTTPTTTSTTMPTTTSTTTPTTTSTTTPTTTTPTTTSTTPTTTTTTTTSTTMSTTTSTKTAISTTKTQNEVTLLPWLILVGALIFLIIITTACFTWRKKCKKQEAGAECHVYDEVSHTTGLQPDSDSPYSLIGPSRPSPISGTNQDLLYSVIGQTPCFENNQDSPYSLIGPSPCSGNDGGLSFPADSTYFLLEKPKAPTNHDEQL